jgi:hypothetical protein
MRKMSATGFAEPSLVTMRKALLCNTVRTTKKSKFFPFLKNIAAPQYLQGLQLILGIQMTH